MEIYDEKIYDLLGERKPVILMSDPKKKKLAFKGLQEQQAPTPTHHTGASAAVVPQVSSENEMNRCIDTAMQAPRATWGRACESPLMLSPRCGTGEDGDQELQA